MRTSHTSRSPFLHGLGMADQYLIDTVGAIKSGMEAGKAQDTRNLIAWIDEAISMLREAKKHAKSAHDYVR